jgi:periplasmic copper chaperone A
MFNSLDSRGPTALALLCATLALWSMPTQAHIVTQPNEAVAGQYFETAFKVPHGCDGAATLALRVTIPAGVLSVKPQMKPGWTVTTQMRPVQPPVQGEGGKLITQSVASVEWRGGPLPDALYDSFGLVMKLPDTPGQTLWFPVVQTCENAEQDWTGIPADVSGWHALRHPAPYVQLKRAP